jgi:very-short-patch-repair endonuclease
LVEGVVAADLFLHAGLVSGLELRAYVAEHRRAKGIARLRQVIDLAEPKTESPMETRLRMLLVLGGLPRPEVQVPLIGKHGEFLGRADLLYSDHRLVLEYDGFNHRERLVDDDRRQNRIVDAGFQILRFTAPDVYRDPESVLIRVRHSLGLPGLRHMRVNGRFAAPRYSQRGGYVD